MERLIGMTEFVLELKNKEYVTWWQEMVIDYANFLSQKLSLEMFVPCKLVEGVWVVLEVPDFISTFKEGHKERFEEFQEAKDRVLFEGGFDFKDERNFNDWRKDNEIGCVEQLIGFDLKLTASAKKTLGI